MRYRLEGVARHWTRVRLSRRIVMQARRRFPCEPIPSLDALHLATALRIRDLQADLQILSLDRRIRDHARALGFEVRPAEA